MYVPRRKCSRRATGIESKRQVHLIRDGNRGESVRRMGSGGRRARRSGGRQSMEQAHPKQRACGVKLFSPRGLEAKVERQPEAMHAF